MLGSIPDAVGVVTQFATLVAFKASCFDDMPRFDEDGNRIRCERERNLKRVFLCDACVQKKLGMCFDLAIRHFCCCGFWCSRCLFPAPSICLARGCVPVFLDAIQVHGRLDLLDLCLLLASRHRALRHASLYARAGGRRRVPSRRPLGRRRRILRSGGESGNPRHGRAEEMKRDRGGGC